jgi:hypothetical protein
MSVSTGRPLRDAPLHIGIALLVVEFHHLGGLVAVLGHGVVLSCVMVL